MRSPFFLFLIVVRQSRQEKWKLGSRFFAAFNRNFAENIIIWFTIYSWIMHQKLFILFNYIVFLYFFFKTTKIGNNITSANFAESYVCVNAHLHRRFLPRNSGILKWSRWSWNFKTPRENHVRFSAIYRHDIAEVSNLLETLCNSTS